MDLRRLITCIALLVTMAVMAGDCSAQFNSLTPGIQAGRDAYQWGESQRRAAVATQVNQNQAQRYPLPWSAPYGETIYYSPHYAPAYQAFSSPWNYTPYTSQYAGLLGTSFVPPIRQPVGQRQLQTGPTTEAAATARPSVTNRLTRPIPYEVRDTTPTYAPGETEGDAGPPPPVPADELEKTSGGPREF